MLDIVCPNCRSVTPPFHNCLACHAPLEGFGDLTSALCAEGTAASPFHGSKRDEVQMDAHLRWRCRRTPKQGIRTLTTDSSQSELPVILKVPKYTDEVKSSLEAEFASKIGLRIITHIEQC